MIWRPYQGVGHTCILILCKPHIVFVFAPHIVLVSILHLVLFNCSDD